MPSVVEYARSAPSLDPEKITPGTIVSAADCAALQPRPMPHLGAAGGQILRLVLREGVTLTLLGLVLGLGGAYLVGRAMQANLYGVSALDVRARAISERRQ